MKVRGRRLSFSRFCLVPVFLVHEANDEMQTEGFGGGGTMSTRLVVADDDFVMRHLLRVMLHKYTVLEATDGEEALQLIRQEQPDAVILDMRMPALTGLQVAQAMRTDSRTAVIPILFITLYDEFPSLEKAIANKDSLYLAKPFGREELLSYVKEVLSLRSVA